MLARLIRRAQPLVRDQPARVREAFRSRRRGTPRLLQEVPRVRHQKGDAVVELQLGLYQRLIDVTNQTVRQAERVRQAIAAT